MSFDQPSIHNIHLSDLLPKDVIIMEHSEGKEKKEQLGNHSFRYCACLHEDFSQKNVVLFYSH